MICFEDENLIAAYKEPNIPTVPLKSNTEQDTLLKMVSAKYPEVLTHCSNNYWEGTTIHRLDTATSGLVLFARNKSFFNYLTKIQKEDQIIKTYSATCQKVRTDNIINNSSIESYFRSYGKKGMYVKVVFNVKEADTDKKYKTEYEYKTSEQDNLYYFTCRITKGFRHQIRAHLSYLGYPILNDVLYNPLCDPNEIGNLKLSCVRITLPLPNGDILDIRHCQGSR